MSAMSTLSTVKGSLTFGIPRATPVTTTSCTRSTPWVSSPFASAVPPAVTVTSTVSSSYPRMEKVTWCDPADTPWMM